MSARTILAVALFVAAATQLSCNVNEYCLNCARGDGGGRDGSIDGGSDDANDGGACVPTGPEICDGKDNDCNGLVDDNVPDVGQLCANQIGECAGGVKQCTNGMLTCSKNPMPEICDSKDNDCNGLTDEGDPGGGAFCGNGVGECKQGTNRCISGSIQCIGAVGPIAEVCDAKDNDCDGAFDEGLTNLGTCGTKTCVGSANKGASCLVNGDCPGGTCMGNVGQCALGTLMCTGGSTICVGAKGPTFETCNMKDDDCDGVIDETFNLNTDPQNCGTCGKVCGSTLVNGGNAVWGCTAGGCVIASCKAGYHDNNNNPADGCEFGPCFTSGVEVCDGLDNNCNGLIDENLGPPPAICATAGECAGTVATCDGTNGWRCHYGATVSTDPTSMGTVIVPETLCDGKDNDCNTRIDDNQPNKGLACDDGKLGVCRGTGTFTCNAANLNGPAVCTITMPGGTASPERCDNIDNNCNGMVDEGGSTGSLIGQDWIAIGGGKQMMKYEASKPDANATTDGVVTAITCSKVNALPWTNLTYPQAVTACANIGARLCTDQEWHRACSVVGAPTYPIALAGVGVVSQLVEAEDYQAIAAATDTSVAPGVTHSWVEDYTLGFSGISDMQAQPDSGSALTNANTATMGPRLDYTFNFQKASATYHIWVLMNSPNINGNQVAVTVDAGVVGNGNQVSTTIDQTWEWDQPTNTFTIAAGAHTVHVYMMLDGVKIDAIQITDANTTPTLPANSRGGHWAYAAMPNTYQPMVCNGQDYDPLVDATLPTGTLASCYANGGAVDRGFDMSGNVKEWTTAHQPGQNPIRGGASNSTAEGISCSLNFTLADDLFKFPNVGFRCCR